MEAAGGGIYTAGGRLTIYNCTFYENVARASGGSLALSLASATGNIIIDLHNTLLYKNSATNGSEIGVLLAQSSKLRVTHTIKNCLIHELSSATSTA